MKGGSKGMGHGKHRRSGHATKSPKFRHAAKMSAERDERKDNTRIRDPKGSVEEIFRNGGAMKEKT